MKRFPILILMLLNNILGYAEIYEAPSFKIPYQSEAKLLKNDNVYTFCADTSLMLDGSNQITGLAISGTIILENRESIVRVLLVDKKGKEYLVFEDFYMFPKDQKHDFSGVAMETAILENIHPYKLNIYIRDAKVENLQIIETLSDLNRSSKTLLEDRAKLLLDQEQYLIQRQNKINSATGKFWIAGKTSISNLSYSEKKIVLGAIDNHYLSDGIEYYVGGFYVVQDHKDKPNLGETSNIRGNAEFSYVESFDWRNRHGKNWMTAVKNQINPYNNISGNGGCWAFGSIAALESHLNLYYNKLLNLDLSEQELGSCSSGSLHTGGSAAQAYYYIKNNNITSEECFPFLNSDTIPCSDKCSNPVYTASITSYSYLSGSTNQLKSELIQHGPIASGYSNGYTNHLMCLCGYGTITEGTHIYYAPQVSAPNIDTIIPANSDLIGKTYWIYKNSYGDNNPTNGYLYIVYENDNSRNYSYRLSYPVTVSNLTDNDIVCEDADNDGYYFWGLGERPSNCPICCPATPDGDDSNPQLAEMDEYGNFSSYSFPYDSTIVTANTTFDTNQIHCGNIIIKNNAMLVIAAELTMNPAAKIIVRDGGTLIVDAGSVVNAQIDVLPSAKIILKNDGHIYLKKFGNLNIQLGAEANLEDGHIMLQ